MSTHIVSTYTDAHFAATLLECGPHTWQTCTCDKCCTALDPRVTREAGLLYRERVHRHFDKMWPGLPIDLPYSSAANEWTIFWGKYRDWVEDTP